MGSCVVVVIRFQSAYQQVVRLPPNILPPEPYVPLIPPQMTTISSPS
jgi:hypothetical protein